MLTETETTPVALLKRQISYSMNSGSENIQLYDIAGGIEDAIMPG